ncbi:MAG: hypothetical protein NVSMB47_07520 [Polyangiales bacterium]
MTAPKRKVSLSLSADLLALVDHDARLRNDTRSGIVEQWLRRASIANAASEIDDATAEYYWSLRGAPRAEAEAIGRGASKAARRVSYDERSPPRPRRRATP